MPERCAYVAPDAPTTPPQESIALQHAISPSPLVLHDGLCIHQCNPRTHHPHPPIIPPSHPGPLTEGLTVFFLPPPATSVPRWLPASMSPAPRPLWSNSASLISWGGGEDAIDQLGGGGGGRREEESGKVILCRQYKGKGRTHWLVQGWPPQHGVVPAAKSPCWRSCSSHRAARHNLTTSHDDVPDRSPLPCCRAAVLLLNPRHPKPLQSPRCLTAAPQPLQPPQRGGLLTACSCM